MKEFSGKAELDAIFSVLANPAMLETVTWLKLLGPMTGKLFMVEDTGVFWSRHHGINGRQLPAGEIILVLSEGHAWRERIYWDALFEEQVVTVWVSYPCHSVLSAMASP